MSDKIGWILRDASGLEILGAGGEDSSGRPDARGDQSAVRQVPDAKGGIDTFLGQVDLSVAERQPDVDIRIGPKKISQYRYQMQATENDGRRHAEFALWRRVLPRHDAFGLAHVFQDPFAGGDVGPTCICQADPAA